MHSCCGYCRVQRSFASSDCPALADHGNHRYYGPEPERCCFDRAWRRWSRSLLFTLTSHLPTEQHLGGSLINLLAVQPIDHLGNDDTGGCAAEGAA
jgi:hypothetical protein